ncbi:MAG: sulfate ABC transporter substrate-binding protein [Gemmataceae bacterium]|nr:sulfate ABC transporter substrate-binding protein [Gemmataceae bacterium]
MAKYLFLSLATVAALATLTLTGCGKKSGNEILNVSYDPTRELYKEINEKFAAKYEKEKGVKLEINVSHGASGSQARSVIDGLKADIVTLALPSDTDSIRLKGNDLLAEGWEKRLPNDSLPYHSTIVFVVRKGNPKNIKDWDDLVKGDVKIITPNPKTSGNGKLSFLAAWGYVITNGKSEDEAKAFVKDLYERVPVLDTGARGSTVSFAKNEIGDVHLSWENEAYYQVKEFEGKQEVVYPSTSIMAEPKVAWVDKVVEKKGTKEIAEAYLRYLYTDEGQEIIAKNFYRPYNEAILKKAEWAKPIKLFKITAIAQGWDDASKKFFAEGGVFDQIYQKPAGK